MLTGGPDGYQEKHVGVGAAREAGLSADGRESGHQYVLRVGPSSRVAQLVATGPGAGTTLAGKPCRSTDAVPAGAVFVMPSRTGPVAGMLRIGGDATTSRQGPS
jgi:hypothetical protein